MLSTVLLCLSICWRSSVEDARSFNTLYCSGLQRKKVVTHCLDSSLIVNIVATTARLQIARSNALQEYLLVPVNLCEKQRHDGDYQYSCVLLIDHVLLSVDSESHFLLAVSHKCQ